MSAVGDALGRPWPHQLCKTKERQRSRPILPSKYASDFAQAFIATISPVALRARSAVRKWMPPYRREIPAWSAASWNVVQRSVTVLAGVVPGSTVDVPGAKLTESPNCSLPVHSARMVAPAALNVL